MTQTPSSQSGPPPLPLNPKTSPPLEAQAASTTDTHSLPGGSASTPFVLKPYDEFQKLAWDLLRKFKLPITIIGVLGWAFGTFVTSIIVDNSATATGAVLSVAGMWMGFIAFLANTMLPGSSFAGLFKPTCEAGRFARLLFFFGVALLISPAYMMMCSAWLCILILPLGGVLLFRLHEKLGEPKT